MSLEADLLIDRRRLKRSLFFWRLLAILCLLAALVFAASRRQGLSFATGQHLARVRIEGVIGDGEKTAALIDRLRTDRSVAGILLHLDTPGGAVSGGEALHDAVARLAAAKPVVAVMDGTAASAGYMIAVATPHIVARASTLTGSIGVLLESPDVSGLLAKLGVSIEPLASGPLKAQPSVVRPLSPQGRDYLQGLIGDLFDQFVGLIAAGRHMDPARVRQLADGRAYTGRQALANGLVDELGGEPEARAWLVRVRHVPSGLPVRDAKETPPGLRAYLTTELTGLILGAEPALRVDGAWALWQPRLGAE